MVGGFRGGHGNANLLLGAVQKVGGDRRPAAFFSSVFCISDSGHPLPQPPLSGLLPPCHVGPALPCHCFQVTEIGNQLGLRVNPKNFPKTDPDRPGGIGFADCLQYFYPTIQSRDILRMQNVWGASAGGPSGGGTANNMPQEWWQVRPVVTALLRIEHKWNIALPPHPTPSVQRTACPTNTWCSDRINLVPKLIRYRVSECQST